MISLSLEKILHILILKNRGISIGNQYQNDINGALKANPFLPMYDEDGNYHYALDWDPTGENPVALMDYAHGQNLTKKHNIKANAYVTFYSRSKT